MNDSDIMGLWKYMCLDTCMGYPMATDPNGMILVSWVGSQWDVGDLRGNMEMLE